MAEDLLEKIAETPSNIVQGTIDTSKEIGKTLSSGKPLKDARRYWKLLGPGLTTGAADDDPAGIATYSQAGAQFGNQFLWLAGLTFPLMSVVQEMCARIGLVTGRGLAANIRLHFPKWVLYICTVLLLVANTLNVGANLGAMAKATQLLVPEIHFTPILLGFTFLTLLLQIFTTYERYAHILKFLALILFSYILTAFALNLNWEDVLWSAVVPTLTLSKEGVLLITAVLGTTISPYLFFWQTSQEVEEKILEGKTTLAMRREVTKSEIRNMRIDVWSGMFISNLVMFFIIAVCAATLFSNGIMTINTAADAAEALRPLAGDFAYTLFAAGIIGTGLLAVPVLAGSAAYAISESFGWKAGLHRKLKEAGAFYGVIIFSLIIGVELNYVGLDPIKALLYSAILNGLIAPLILFLIVTISSSEKVMGERKNGAITKLMGWAIVIIMTLAGIATIFSLFL